MLAEGFLNIAHRGARAFAPENTLPAIRLASRHGANAVEIDVQMSQDGELVVVHDDDLVRCSNVREYFPDRSDYSVSAFTQRELELLDAGSWYAVELIKPAGDRQSPFGLVSDEEQRAYIVKQNLDDYSSGLVKIPRVRDALLLARDLNLTTILELKTIPRRYPDIAAKTVALVQELGLEANVLISSFDHTQLAEVRRLSAPIATGVLTSERLYRVREYVASLQADAIHPASHEREDVIRRGVSPEEIDVDMIGELTRAGLLVHVWTENAPERMRKLIEAGVTGIFTDFPNRLTAVLNEIAPSWSSHRPVLRSPQRAGEQPSGRPQTASEETTAGFVTEVESLAPGVAPSEPGSFSHD